MKTKFLEFRAEKLDKGLNLNTNRALPFGTIVSGNAARFERGSGIETGPGYRQVANLSLSTSDVISSFEGTVFPLHWVCADIAVRHSADPDAGTYYSVGASQTSTERSTLIEQGNGDIFIINQTDVPLRIALARNTVAIADTDVTITVGAAWIGKFNAAGAVYIRGDTISYTGKNATQLTGVTGIVAGGHPINSIVSQISSPSTFDIGQAGTCAMILESRLIVGGVLRFENVAYYGAPEDANNPAFFYDFDANGAGSYIFPGKIVAMIKGIDRGYIFTDRQIFQTTGFDVSTGALLVTPITQYQSAYNARCVVDMEGIIAFFGNRRLIPITLQLSPEGNAVPFIAENFDDAIRPWLDALDDDADQTDAMLHYDRTTKLLKIWARRGGSRECYVYDRQQNLFLPAESRPASSISMFRGRSYFGGIGNGLVYRDDIGRTNAGLAISHKWATPRMEYEDGRIPMFLHSLEYQGWMSEGVEHTLRLYLDGSSTASLTKTFDDDSITTTQGTPLGARGVGLSLIGGDPVSSTYVYPYKINVILQGLSCEDMQLEWQTTKEGAYFSTDSFLLRAAPMGRSQRTYQ